MTISMLYALSLIAVAAAQSSSTTVFLLLPLPDTQTGLVGSIKGSDATATTYLVGCAGASATPSSMEQDSNDTAIAGQDCAFPMSQTIIQGPSTFHWSADEGVKYTYTYVLRLASQQLD